MSRSNLPLRKRTKTESQAHPIQDYEENANVDKAAADDAARIEFHKTQRPKDILPHIAKLRSLLGMLILLLRLLLKVTSILPWLSESVWHHR